MAQHSPRLSNKYKLSKYVLCFPVRFHSICELRGWKLKKSKYVLILDHVTFIFTISISSVVFPLTLKDLQEGNYFLPHGKFWASRAVTKHIWTRTH